MKIKDGRYFSEINEIEKILKKIKILEERNYFPQRDFDPSEYRNKSYTENWKLILTNNSYDFILADNSIIQFKKFSETTKLSYTFFECPYKCVTYSEFLVDNDLIDENNMKNFYDYYENYLDGCPYKESFTMIRYDFDKNSYTEGVHPISHIHIGFKNQVRLGIDKIISPLSFTSFILRQHFPSYWKELIKTDYWHYIYNKLKKDGDRIDKVFWNKLDKLEYYLT